MRSHVWRVAACCGLAAIAVVSTVAGVVAERTGSFPATLFRTEASLPAPGGGGGGAAGGTAPRPTPIEADGGIFDRTIRGYHPPPGDGGGVVRSTPRTQAGPTLLVSADAAEVRLIDVSGNVVHSWTRAFDDVGSWRGDSRWGPTWPPRHQGRLFFRDARLLGDGGLLALFEGLGLVRLDVKSEVQWASRVGQMHDSFDVTADGTIYALSRRVVVRRLGLATFRPPGDRIVESELVVLKGDGREVGRISLLDALLDSDHALLLEWGKHVDPLGAVSVHVARHGRYRGQLVVCLRNLGSIAIINQVSRQVTSVFAGLVDLPSSATALRSGHILAFGNASHGGHASVLEFEPLTQKIVWRYPMPGEPPLRSTEFGTCQRLRNNNTLITESFAGRAIEVTSNGEIAWEYRTPYRFGESAATLFRAERIDPRSMRFTPRGAGSVGR